MIVETLHCNSCGAPLEVPKRVNFVKCNHCGQQLAVRRSDTETFTEAVDRLSETTESLTAQVHELTRQNQIAELDRRWEQQREAYMVRGKNGRVHLPSEGSSLLAGLVIGVFGCIWTVLAIGITSGAPSVGPFAIIKVAFPAFGILFVIGGVTTSMRNYQKAQEYHAARRQFEAERQRLMRSD